jgi:hypothetical protein
VGVVRVNYIDKKTTYRILSAETRCGNRLRAVLAFRCAAVAIEFVSLNGTSWHFAAVRFTNLNLKNPRSGERTCAE